MAGYFSNFSQIVYNLSDTSQITPQLVTNILQRSTFLREVRENTAVSYKYQVKDTDTPEIIAHKLYGDVNRHWIVLLFNKIMNPYYEFPMNESVFSNYIQNKYGHDEYTSRSTIHHYEKQVSKNLYKYGVLKSSNTQSFIISSKSVNANTGTLTDRTMPALYTSEPVVAESFTTTFSDGVTVTQDVNLVAVSEYDYEFALNESRREIVLLDVSYISTVEKEFKAVMRNG
jgi:hypothetical protein